MSYKDERKEGLHVINSTSLGGYICAAYQRHKRTEDYLAISFYVSPRSIRGQIISKVAGKNPR